jgi:hypothetical protein
MRLNLQFYVKYHVQVAATVNNSTDTMQQLSVAILLTFKELPSAIATSVTASSIITQLQVCDCMPALDQTVHQVLLSPDKTSQERECIAHRQML